MKLPLSRTAQPVFAPNWHPNFRNTQLLPDLKVVRTAFFINASCIAVASAVLMLTGYREYQAHDLRSKMGDARARMAELQTENGKLLAMNKEFMEGARKFEEAREFVNSRISGTTLLVALAGTLPELMEFTAVNYEKNQLSLRGTIRLDSETASQRASGYLDTLRQDEFIGATFTDISLTNLQRDPGGQGMSFEIVLKQPEKTDGRKPARIRK